MTDRIYFEPRIAERRSVAIDIGAACLHGDMTLPEAPIGLVLFADGAGSHRASPENRTVAEQLFRARIGAVLLDLFTDEEALLPHEARFDVRLRSERLWVATEWLRRHVHAHAPIGYFGVSTGAAAALVASIGRREVRAIVACSGRFDIALDALPRVTAPTLFVVGGEDPKTLAKDREAAAHMHRAETHIEIVDGATHEFAEPGTLERAGRLAARWFEDHFVSGAVVKCMDCGSLVDREIDRGCAVADERSLCFDCAVARGGVYDPHVGRWVIAPEQVPLGRRPSGFTCVHRESVHD